MGYPPPFFKGLTIRLYEHNLCLQIADGKMNLLAAFRPELLIDVNAKGGALCFFGATFSEPGEAPGVRTFDGFSEDDARLAAQTIGARYHLPKPLEIVSEQEVRGDPHSFDGRHIELTATWTVGFEHSTFAGTWLEGGPRMPGASDPRRHRSGLVRVRGIWQSSPSGRYGHLGCSTARLVAYQSWLVDEAR